MKKLFSLLLALALMLLPVLSVAEEDTTPYQNIYAMLLEQLNAADLILTPYDESYQVYLGYELEKNTYGNADIMLDAYADAFTINASYQYALDESLVPQVLSFFNYVNDSIYVGKLMLSKVDGAWYPTYEIFVSVNPDDIGEWDRDCVLAYTSLALETLEEMTDYLTELTNGETPENVFAMWQADVGVV